MKPKKPKPGNPGRAAARPKTIPKKVKDKTTPWPSAEELTREFLQTPEMVEHARMLARIDSDLDEDAVFVTVRIPHCYAYMLNFLETNNAAAAGRVPDTLDEIMQQMFETDLADILHHLTVAPLSFERYRDLWNYFCDQKGVPQHKIGAEEPKPDGPF
jgi:hypothetical protein